MRRRIIPVALVASTIILLAFWLFPGTVFSEMAIAVTTIGGATAIFYQIYKENVIAEGNFVLSLDQQFTNNEKVWKIATKLFDVENPACAKGDVFSLKGDGITEEDRLDLMAYLTFFETLYLLIEKSAVTIEEVDQLFRRRFFKAVMNRQVQDIELVTFDYGYTNIYRLNSIWLKYLRANGQADSIEKHGIPLEQAYAQRQFKELLSKIPECDPEIFFSFDDELISDIACRPDSLLELISVEGSVIAGGILWYPREVDREEIGSELGLPAGSYAQIDNTVVAPSHRGRNLQVEIIHRLIKNVRSDVGVVVATVSPKNIASLRNFEKCGFKVIKEVNRHGAYPRCVVSKDIRKS